MPRPKTPSAQCEGKAHAELLRGSGRWPLQPHLVELEPPGEEYDRGRVTAWDCVVNDWNGPWRGGWLPVHRRGRPLTLPRRATEPDLDLLIPITVEPFAEDRATLEKAEQLIRSLATITQPVAFELIGHGPEPQFDHEKFQAITKERQLGHKTRRYEEAIIGWDEPGTHLQFVVPSPYAKTLHQQLLAHYPNSAIVVGTTMLRPDDLPINSIKSGDGLAATLYLEAGYLWPLKTFTQLDTDPLAVAIAALDDLGKYQWGAIQVLFQPARFPWRDSLEDALGDPYDAGSYLFPNISARLLDEKFSAPLFAVSVRLMASTQPVYEHLLGWAHQFANPPQALLAPEPDEAGVEDEFSWALQTRSTYTPGILLNARELAGLVHLPGVHVVSERLRRIKVRTKAAPALPRAGEAVCLGVNVHRGVQQAVWVPGETRLRHCYIAGASGTGKSTLLLTMICQDIESGRGVGVIDPHGDLIDAVLARIPAERVHDVAYFNPADVHYPPAFNPLECKDATERERVVAETVAMLHRFFADSWGPQLEQYLTYALVTLLKFRTPTLEDLNRILTDDTFRRRHLAKITDPLLLAFWNKEFATAHAKHAVRPVLNKLVPFLLYPTVANVVCQRTSAFDFDRIINERQILLVRLPLGVLSEQMIKIFGTFIMSKLVSAAFRREKIAEELRVPFYLYIDEFQNFMHLAISFDRLLSEARKYKLVLAGLANQYVEQLSHEVRAAIFGNVKTLVVFRVSPLNARLLVSEFAGFTAEEITSLDTGQAIARVGGSRDAFNLACGKGPAALEPSYAEAIITYCREVYTRPPLVPPEQPPLESPTFEEPSPEGEEEPVVADDNDDDVHEPAFVDLCQRYQYALIYWYRTQKEKTPLLSAEEYRRQEALLRAIEELVAMTTRPLTDGERQTFRVKVLKFIQAHQRHGSRWWEHIIGGRLYGALREYLNRRAYESPQAADQRALPRPGDDGRAKTRAKAQPKARPKRKPKQEQQAASPSPQSEPPRKQRPTARPTDSGPLPGSINPDEDFA